MIRYKMRVWAIVLFVFALTHAQSASPDLDVHAESLSASRNSLFSVLWRSALLPGWGHFLVGQPDRGTIWTGLAACAMGYTAWRAVAYQEAQNKLDDYKSHEEESVYSGESAAAWVVRANSTVKTRNEEATQLNFALGALAVVWLANLIDAAWVATHP
ncbi:MAG TPA: hypothetical protein VLM37_11880, partial [Fibrobacteraceae bacterium]|nr:hypothetical protein [Fibrobacteraceae bacterium]